jgi:hypothetical protein
MSKSPPAAPAQPDPRVVAEAQTGSNVTTGISNSYLGNANQFTPYGDTTFEVGDYASVTDPTTGVTYQIPRFNQTQTLAPAQQTMLDQQNQAGIGLNTIANQQIGRIGGVLGSPVQAPAGGIQTSFGDTSTNPVHLYPELPQSGVAYTFRPTETDLRYDFQSDLGPQDWSQDRQRVEEAIYSRLNPQLQRDRDQLDSRLINQGFTSGSEGYNQGMDEFNRQANDARMQAILAGGQEQSRLFGLDLQQGQFYNQGLAAQNQAQQQDFDQAAARGQFYNQSQNQDFSQLLAQQQAYNAAQNQYFNQNQAQAAFNNQAYAQQLQTDLALRNQPLNETSALMSGGQVQLPNFTGYNPGQVANTPVGDYYMQNAQIAAQNYQAQLGYRAQQQAGLYGGIGSILGAGLYGLGRSSDARIKEDVVRIGTMPNSLPIYTFRYIGEEGHHMGFMAQEVEKLYPMAVFEVDGVKHVNYGMAVH